VLLELCSQAALGNCWLGLLPSGGNESSFSWTDGSVDDFFAWMPDYPGEYPAGSCGYVAAKTQGSHSTSLWKTAACDAPLAYLCMVDGSASSELYLHSNVTAALDVKVLNETCSTPSQAGEQMLPLCWQKWNNCLHLPALLLLALAAHVH
jgi:hypothetical protein